MKHTIFLNKVVCVLTSSVLPFAYSSFVIFPFTHSSSSIPLSFVPAVFFSLVMHLCHGVVPYQAKTGTSVCLYVVSLTLYVLSLFSVSLFTQNSFIFCGSYNVQYPVNATFIPVICLIAWLKIKRHYWSGAETMFCYISMITDMAIFVWISFKCVHCSKFIIIQSDYDNP